MAQKYIAYRNQRSIARKAKTRDVFLDIVNIKNNDVTRENANMNADTPAGMMMKFASETTKPFVDDYLLSEESRDAVEHNYLHIHDKDYYPTKSLTCFCVGLYLHGVLSERDAWRTGDSCLRLLSGTLCPYELC